MTLVLVLTVLALVIWLAAALMRSAPPAPDRDRAGRDRAADNRAIAERPVWDRAEEILAERFARGEIDDDEYARRLGALRTGRSTPLAGAV
ncbi:MAG: SHOCT domain-containing protein [Acidimicrobiia bacterium]|nr:SHOCT domain-containing protein [Acidimicrobiia bacterium]